MYKTNLINVALCYFDSLNYHKSYNRFHIIRWKISLVILMRLMASNIHKLGKLFRNTIDGIVLVKF